MAAFQPPASLSTASPPSRLCFTEGVLPRSLWIAAYDVRDPKRLRRALQVLKGYSTGGQKSVFECFLTEGERRRLLSEIAVVLSPDDSFLLVRLDPRSQVRTLGRGIPPENPPFFYVS